MSQNLLPIAYFDGEFVPVHNANVSIATHGLQYGTTVFSGMRTLTEDGAVLVFRLEDHARRLSRGARLLNGSMESEDIAKIIIAFLEKNAPKAPAYLRPFIYCDGAHPVPALHFTEKKLAIYGLEFPGYLSEAGVTMTFSSYPRMPDIVLPARGKIGGAYWTSSAAKTEAQLRGFDDAIMLNTAGKVAEGTGMNLFLVKDGVLITPDITQDILEGITRDSVLQMARHLGIPTVERVVDRSELLFADEVFLSGTAAGVTSVRKIETFDLPENRPIAAKLKEAYQLAIRGKLTGFEHWITRVPI